jgi:lycopene beta-cyclase
VAPARPDEPLSGAAAAAACRIAAGWRVGSALAVEGPGSGVDPPAAQGLPESVDLAIIGAGLAGLSLALALLERPAAASLRILVIESRPRLVPDRIWSRFARGPGEHDESCRWPAWRVSVAGGQSLRVEGKAGWSYRAISSERLQARFRARLACSAPRLSAAFGEPVLDIQRSAAHPGRWQLRTETFAVNARYVVDTRPPPSAEAAIAPLHQVFTGLEVRTEAALFDPSTVGLMEGLAGDRSGLGFDYVLPFSPHHALIEHTRFTASPPEPGVLWQATDASVARLTRGAPFEVLRREAGWLPMGMPRGQRSLGPGHVVAGMAGGAIRPATGYAHARISRWADACATSIAQGAGPIPHPPDPWWQTALDHHFLRVLAAHPGEGPRLFLQLFERTQPSQLCSFLADSGRMRDALAVVAAVPKWPFLRGVFQRWVST